jgi:hypothetical protein
MTCSARASRTHGRTRDRGRAATDLRLLHCCRVLSSAPGLSVCSCSTPSVKSPPAQGMRCASCCWPAGRGGERAGPEGPAKSIREAKRLGKRPGYRNHPKPGQASPKRHQPPVARPPRATAMSVVGKTSSQPRFPCSATFFASAKVDHSIRNGSGLCQDDTPEQQEVEKK